MITWAFCDELGAPEIAVCMDSIHWNTNYNDIMDWLDSNNAGSRIGDRVLFIYEDKRSLFLLKFG